MKILVTGGNGQVGWELSKSLLVLGEVIALDRSQLDICNADDVRNIVREIKPDVIVNAAAYTAVDKAEAEADLAMQANSVAPGILAEEAGQLNALLIHYSTDYVFDGTKDGVYLENDPPKPVNMYGKSKLGGERAIQSCACDSVILRTSWVYSIRGNNFLLSMLRLGAEREELKIVDDQIGAPTWARMIAETTAKILSIASSKRLSGNFESGLYHLASRGETSWCGFAQSIFDYVRSNRSKGDSRIPAVLPITTKEYPTPAARPANSRLSINKIEKKFDLLMPDWHDSLQLCMSEL